MLICRLDSALYTTRLNLIIYVIISFNHDSFADPPSLIAQAPDQVVLEGDPAIHVNCTADGEPAPNITWTKVFANGTDSHVLSTDEQFLLPNNRINKGTYRCKASNGIGSDVNHTVIVVVNCEYYLLLVSHSNV